MPDSYTRTNKPSDSTYSKVIKPTDPAGFDFSFFDQNTFDETTQDTYSKISKPTDSTYSKILKPTS